MWDKALSIILVIAILGGLGMLGYVIATPAVGEEFTQFYILGQEGKAADYPQELKLGEEGKVVVGVDNYENQDVSYYVEIRLEGAVIGELGPLILEHEQKWEQEVYVTPVRVGEDQKLEFLLFKDGEDVPCKSLHLQLDVKE